MRETGPSAIHPIAIHSETDPALDAANAITAGKLWFIPSLLILQIRNTGNTDWESLGAV
jgi:hypothetical protein